MKRMIVLATAAAIGALRIQPATLAEPTSALHPDHPAWFGTGKRQAQWKRERKPMGKSGRR